MIYSLLAFAGAAAAAIPAGLTAPSTAGFMNPTVHVSTGGRAVCVTGNVSVYANATNLKFNYTTPANQSVLTNTFVEYITSGSPFTTQIMNGTQKVSGTYNISSTFCMPSSSNSSNSSTVQLLTHGIGFDKSYWDFAPGYSYIDAAIDAGYSVLSYDRLGVGMSSKPDALNIVQGALEVDIAYKLIMQLRNGTFGRTSFKTVVGTGHSFGSEITNAVTVQWPTALDAAVLTGFSGNSTSLAPFISALNLAIAAENQPYRFSALNNSYLVSSSAISNQIGFFRAPGFDPNILSLAEATKGTVTIGELFSQGTFTGAAMNFTGPVTIVNGMEDLPFCFGNCSYPMNLAAAALTDLYPNASNTSTYLPSPVGHGVNLHYAAEGAYAFINNFLASSL